MAFFVLMAAPQRNIRSVAFWDAQAPWQQNWLAHCRYHREVIPLVLEEVQPGWQVLDIGAGSGVLALPLVQQGCRVTALEPSRGMRDLLWQSLRQHPTVPLWVEHRSWEAMPLTQLRGYHLMLACNSLHVTSWGFSRALAKMFRAGPEHVCVISETRFLPKVPWPQPAAYARRWQRQLTVDSSVAYHALEEAWQHFQHYWGRPPTWEEKTALAAELRYQDEHYWLQQEAHLTICWWSKNGGEELDAARQESIHWYAGCRTAGELAGDAGGRTDGGYSGTFSAA